MANLDAHFLRGDDARLLEDACKTGNPFRFDKCFSQIMRTISNDEIVDFVGCLCTAMTSGPHYALLQHLINVYQVPVTGKAFCRAMTMEIPHTEKTKLLDFLFDKSEVDVNSQPGGESYTFLDYCKHDAELAEYFLKRGADPNLGVRKGEPVRSYWGQDERKLLPNSGSTLAYTIHCGDTEVVKILVQYGAKLEYAGAVHYAVERGEEEMLRQVLELGGDIEQENRDWINRVCLIGTPLYRAVKQGKLEMVNILLEHGASVFGIGKKEPTSYPPGRMKETGDKGDTSSGYQKGRVDTTVLELVMGEGIDEQIRQVVLEAAEPEYEFVSFPECS